MIKLFIAYDSGQTQIGTGLTPGEYRDANIVSERIGKGAVAITFCALAAPAACSAAAKGLDFSLFVSYGTNSPLTTAGAIGSAYGGILGGIYGNNLATWANGSSSFTQRSVLWVNKSGSIFGGKEVGVSLGNGTALGGSVDPLLDPATNPWWGAKNTWDLVRGKK